ncbi:MAG: NAD-dependent epimerase/dehydratase family protein [Patescibacteria group bacterium]
MQSFNNKRVLIFGGLGLIGSGVARMCIAQGASVTIADNRAPIFGANDFNLSDLDGKFELLTGDVRELNFVQQAVRDKDYVLNFAAQVDHVRSIEDPILDNQLNCVGHLNVLLACRDINPDAILFYPGSRLQYGSTPTLPVAESHPRRPISLYAIHKNTAEQYYQVFSTYHGIRLVCIRITNPYGPRAQMKNPRYGLVNWFVRQALDGKTITVYGNGRQQRDYIYIDDLVDGILQVIATPKCFGHVYNLGSGQGTRFIDMAKTVVQAVGQGEVVSVPWPKQFDTSESGDFYADIAAITSDTTWTPVTNLSSGIQQTVEYYRVHRDKYWTRE